MKPNIIHSIVVCLAAFTLPFMVACGSQEEPVPGSASEATLFLDVTTVEATRTGTAALPDNEKMSSVRVVILHTDGTVEHNKFYAMDGAQEQKHILLKVRPGEKKRIYLFANEESVSRIKGTAHEGSTLSAFLDDYSEGQSGFDDAVKNLYFTPDYRDGRPIPMSSVYEMDFPEQGTVRKTFHVVRVATKFMINFINWHGEEVVVDNLTIENYADKNFLMAHVGSYPHADTYPTWIDWLAEACGASSGKDDPAATEAAGWLTDYDLPAQADKTKPYVHAEPVTVGGAVADTDHPENSRPGAAKDIPVFYLPESRNMKAGATDGEQEYILAFTIKGRTEPFVCRLPNLKALFRNTHVNVNVTMNHGLDFSVDVIPFTPVKLEPDFGLDREEFTGYIRGKDSQGRPCWYNGTDGPYYLGPTDNPGAFVTVNDSAYLLVYTDYERTAANLNHMYEKETRRKYLLTPEGITGYKHGNDMYINRLRQRVWLDAGGDPDGDPDSRAVYEALQKVGLNLKCCRILYEWDRLDWNKARWWGWEGIYPAYWFDVLGNRRPWSEGDTEEKRKAILGEWVQYLE